MSRPASDLEAEREIDLARLRDIALAQWWVIVLGLVGGLVVGALYSLSGGSVYNATARIAPGQAFNPSGSSPVLTYLTNQNAINEIATSATTIEQAAAAAGMSPGELRGHVRTSAVNQGTGTQSAARNAVLVDITVQLNRRKRAEDAANAVARVVQQATTSRYVRQSIAIYATRIDNFNTRLKTLRERVALLDRALRQSGLSLNESLLLAIQLDQAQASQGQTIDSLVTAQQQQILAQDVQRTQIIQGATAEKSTARSRRSSMLVGAVIGLILGAIVAAAAGLRSRPPTPA